jgi:hypothetical protein
LGFRVRGTGDEFNTHSFVSSKDVLALSLKKQLGPYLRLLKDHPSPRLVLWQGKVGTKGHMGLGERIFLLHQRDLERNTPPLRRQAMGRLMGG